MTHPHIIGNALAAGILLAATSAVSAQDQPPPTDPPNLQMTADTGTGRLVFEWNSKVGRRYNLRQSPDLQGPPLGWSVAKGDIIGSPPLNSVSISLPAAPTMFYVVEEFPAPPLEAAPAIGRFPL